MVTLVAGGAVPVGVMFPFAGLVADIPTGFLLCDGSTLNRNDFSDLYAAIGSAHGDGDGAITFEIPDNRGTFLRGVDHGRGYDGDSGARTFAQAGGNTGDLVGSQQPFASKNHKHFSGSGLIAGSLANSYFPYGGVYQNWGVGNKIAIAQGQPASFFAMGYTQTIGESANETRPKNNYTNYIIKY